MSHLIKILAVYKFSYFHHWDLNHRILVDCSTVQCWMSPFVFHCAMLDESICHFRGAGSIFSLLFNF